MSPMASALFIIDQTGLPAGGIDKARTDGLSTGALVTLTARPGSLTNRFRFLWTPEDDTTAVSSLVQTSTPNVWEFSPTAGVHGTYVIKSIANEGLSTEAESIRIFAIRDINGLRMPALNERADPNANLENDGASVIAASWDNATDYADPNLNARPYSGWWRAWREMQRLISFAVTTVAGSDGITPTTPQLGAVTLSGSALLPLDGTRAMTGTFIPYQSTGLTPSEGEVYYDTQEKSLVVQGYTASALGKELVNHGVNKTGVTITKGQPLQVHAANGGRVTLELAGADLSIRYPAMVTGLAAADIANNDVGPVMLSGEITGVDTSSYLEGDTLYVSGTAGQLTNAIPAYPSYRRPIAVVLTSHAMNGVLLVVQSEPDFLDGDVEGFLAENEVVKFSDVLVEDSSVPSPTAGGARLLAEDGALVSVGESGSITTLSTNQGDCLFDRRVGYTNATISVGSPVSINIDITSIHGISWNASPIELIACELTLTERYATGRVRKIVFCVDTDGNTVTTVVDVTGTAISDPELYVSFANGVVTLTFTAGDSSGTLHIGYVLDMHMHMDALV